MDSVTACITNLSSTFLGNGNS